MESGSSLPIVLAIAATLVGWSLLSAFFERRYISAPMVFVAVGWLLVSKPVAVLHVSIGAAGIREVAELALAVVLFSDAARVSVPQLRSYAPLASRLLLLGLPLTIALGTLCARVLFSSNSWWVCAAIAASVAPTDAALGAPIVEDERMPSRIRGVLNVESGLNDGIATPFVNVFLVAAVAGTIYEHESDAKAILGLVLGVLLGIAVGAGGGWLMRRAAEAGLSGIAYRELAVAAIPIAAYASAVELSGNGFVAAFVAGLAYRSATPAHVDDSLASTKDFARLLSMAVWFLFGAAMVPLLRDMTVADVVFALLALTVVRMLPVALAVIGSGLDRVTVGVVGWFGPRGLASVVFALLAADGLAPTDASRSVVAITTTVLLSVILHGVSAAPVAGWYSKRRH
jgi:NhaP-type Na+/H+ or K+/H+ antiporter